MVFLSFGTLVDICSRSTGRKQKCRQQFYDGVYVTTLFDRTPIHLLNKRDVSRDIRASCFIPVLSGGFMSPDGYMDGAIGWGGTCVNRVTLRRPRTIWYYAGWCYICALDPAAPVLELISSKSRVHWYNYKTERCTNEFRGYARPLAMKPNEALTPFEYCSWPASTFSMYMSVFFVRSVSEVSYIVVCWRKVISKNELI